MKINRFGQSESLNKAQFLEVYSRLPDPHRTILALTWYCAERAGAICQLEVSHCYAGGQPRKVLLIPGEIRKDRRTRELPVSRALNQVLKNYKLPESKFLFPSYFDSTRPIRLQVYAAALKREFLRLGLIGYSSHSARRGAITCLSKAGLNTRQIQKVSGHSSLSSLQTYIDVSPAEISAAVALL
jgi:integrase/recombinase XerD